MAHVRRQIRSAFANLFAGDVPSVFTAVETSRAHRIDQARLPLLTIDFVSETSAHGAGRSAAPVVRTAQWALTLYADGVTVADTLDDMAVVVETAIATDPTLGGVVAHARVISSAVELSGETEKRTGALTLTVETIVATSAGDPETRV